MKEPKRSLPPHTTDTSIPLTRVISLSPESSSVLAPITSWVSSGPTETGDTPELPLSDTVLATLSSLPAARQMLLLPGYSSKHPSSAGRCGRSEIASPGMVAGMEGPRHGQPSPVLCWTP